MQISIDLEDKQAIALAVFEMLKPVLANHSKSAGNDELLTIDEAAEFLKTSKAQVYQWVNSSAHSLGDFPFLKAGKLLRFSKRDILKWLSKR